MTYGKSDGRCLLYEVKSQDECCNFLSYNFLSCQNTVRTSAKIQQLLCTICRLKKITHIPTFQKKISFTGCGSTIFFLIFHKKWLFVFISETQLFFFHPYTHFSEKIMFHWMWQYHFFFIFQKKLLFVFLSETQLYFLVCFLDVNYNPCQPTLPLTKKSEVAIKVFFSQTCRCTK